MAIVSVSLVIMAIVTGHNGQRDRSHRLIHKHASANA